MIKKLMKDSNLKLLDAKFYLDDKPLNFIIQDVMGLESKANRGLHKKDLQMLMEGNIASHYFVSSNDTTLC